MQREAIIDGQRVILSILGPPLEPLLEQFYTAYFRNEPLPWDELGREARDYFDMHPDFGAHNAYFNNFITIWQHMMQQERYAAAEVVWERAVQPALAWEAATGSRLHKGTPYYFWAMSVIMRRDMDRGYLLSHRALQEDVLSSGNDTPGTPGYSLVSLDAENQQQAFRPWVVLQAAFVTDRLNEYNAVHGRNLSFADFRTKFVLNPPDIDTVFLFTYMLARLMNVHEEPAHIRANAFAGQLALNIFFDLTLVMDAVIKARDGRSYFIDHAAFLLGVAGQPLRTQPELGAINGLFNADFDATLRAALNGTLQARGQAMSRLQCDVVIAYQSSLPKKLWRC